MGKLILIVAFLFVLDVSAQSVNENTHSLDSRQSVFTENLKYVFIFRTENQGNVFVYDVVNNTMIHEIISKSGEIIKVIPHDDYFLLITINAIEVYDMKTFGMYYDLTYNYNTILEPKVSKLDVKSSEYNEETNSRLVNMNTGNLSVTLGGDFVACKWDDGKIKLWNWKTKKLLLENTIDNSPGLKDAFKNNISNISFGTNPLRIIYQNGKELKVYDSTMNVISSKELDDYRTIVNYIDATDDFLVIHIVIGVKIKTEIITYEEDLVTEKSRSEMKLGGVLTQNANLNFNVDHGIYGKYSISESYKHELDYDKEYLNYNYSSHVISIRDAFTGEIIREMYGSFSSVSSDGSRLIVKMIQGDLPEYKIDKYKKFFKKRSSMLKGNRYLYRYMKEVDAITYQKIFDVETGKEINSVNTASPMYFFKNIYILENSPNNGSLKLYDYINGKLIKEI